MNKTEAEQLINSVGLNSYDIAQKIYMATVEGISGANQDDGQGFLLTALAELWNINGTIRNHNAGKRVITGRYRNRGVTLERIEDVICQYPNGFRGNTPNFDDLVLGNQQTAAPQYSPQSGGTQRVPSGTGTSSKIFVVVFVIAVLVCRMMFHWGWIASLIVSLLAVGAVEWLKER